MSGWIVVHEAVLRGSAFAAVFVVVAIAETIVEARPLRLSRRVRRTHNLTLTLLNTRAWWACRNHQFYVRQSVRWMLILPFRPTRRRPPIRIPTQQEAA